MGRDKAGMTVDGEPLWQRQLATLRGLAPHELFISGKADGPYVGAGVEIVPDIAPGLGPLSGLEAAFGLATCPFVVVLAIDLPAMTTDFLARLAGLAGANGSGVVPLADGWFEPLAAVYSRDCLPLVQQCLRSEDRSMQAFVRLALTAQLVMPYYVTPLERSLFHNVNTPADLPRG